MKAIVYLGVDQTGAIDRVGKPKPLPACALQGSKADFFYLDRFHPDEIRGRYPDAECQLIIDCVLGLPDELGCPLKWREVISQTLEWQGFGRKVAADFFHSLREERVATQIPRRAIEIHLGANSVFQEHPFQKNIQTGTFRFWKEIASAGSGFRAPWVEGFGTKAQRLKYLPIFEGYPTLVWKKLLKSSSRNPENLGLLLKAAKFQVRWTPKHQALVQKDPNLADAFVLALAGSLWLSKEAQRKTNPEGWILGGDRESE